MFSFFGVRQPCATLWGLQTDFHVGFVGKINPPQPAPWSPPLAHCAQELIEHRNEKHFVFHLFEDLLPGRTACIAWSSDFIRIFKDGIK